MQSPRFMRVRFVVSLLVILAGLVWLHGTRSMITMVSAANLAPAVNTVQSKAPPKFPKHFSKLSRQELKDYLAQIRFSDKSVKSADRKCSDGQESNRCLLEITAVEGSSYVSPDDPSKTGQVVAKIRNIGTLKETVLNIDPGETVLWVVWEHWPIVGFGPNESTFIDSEDPARVNRGKLQFKKCKAKHDNPSPNAMFWLCKEDTPKGPHALVMHLTPPWFPCEDGCCSSGILSDS